MKSCLSTRRCKRGRKRYKASRNKEEFRRKKVWQQNKKMPKIRQETDRKEGRFRLLSDKVDKNRMAHAETSGTASWRRKESDPSQAVDCCLEEVLQKVIALGTNGVEVLFQRVRRGMGALPEQMPGGEEGRRNSENEQEQGRTSQQLVLPTPGAVNKVHRRIVSGA